MPKASDVTKVPPKNLARSLTPLNVWALAFGCIIDFIFWYRTANQGYFGKAHPNLLSLRFEDAVLEYERTCERVEKFVGLDSCQHLRKFQAFDPQVSRRNIGIYKDFLTKSESEKIANELAEFRP